VSSRIQPKDGIRSSQAPLVATVNRDTGVTPGLTLKSKYTSGQRVGMATETDLIRAEQVEVVIVVICRGRACGAVCHVGGAVLAQGLLHSWEAEEVQTAG